jgi:hypothetical protein
VHDYQLAPEAPRNPVGCGTFWQVTAVKSLRIRVAGMSRGIAQSRFAPVPGQVAALLMGYGPSLAEAASDYYEPND